VDLNREQWGDMQCQPNPRHPIRGLMNSVGTMTCGCHHRLPTTAAPQRFAERIEEQWGKSFWMAPVDSQPQSIPINPLPKKRTELSAIFGSVG